MRTLLAATLAALLAPSALALKPATNQFLNEIGFAPDVSEVAAVAADNINGKTLDTLAAKRDEAGVRSFIATRNFIRAFRRNPDAVFPDDELYNIAYLSAPEKLYIATKLAESFPPPKTHS